MFGTAGLFASRPSGNPSRTVAGATLLLLFLVACKGGNNRSSDCYYDQVETHAEVIGLKPHPEGNGRIAVILDFKASSLALNDQELGELKGVNIDHDFLERNHIQMGNKYEVIVSELTKGNCENKLIVAFNHALE